GAHDRRKALVQAAFRQRAELTKHAGDALDAGGLQLESLRRRGNRDDQESPLVIAPDINLIPATLKLGTPGQDRWSGRVVGALGEGAKGRGPGDDPANQTLVAAITQTELAPDDGWDLGSFLDDLRRRCGV